MGKVYFLAKSGFSSKISCCSMSGTTFHNTFVSTFMHTLSFIGFSCKQFQLCVHYLNLKKRCHILWIVWNYLSSDTAQHSKQQESWKITWLIKFLEAATFKNLRDFIIFYISSINSRNFMDIAKIISSILTYDTLTILR